MTTEESSENLETKKVYSESSFLRNALKEFNNDLKKPEAVCELTSQSLKDFDKKYSKSLNDLTLEVTNGLPCTNGNEIPVSRKKSMSSLDKPLMCNENNKLAQLYIANLIMLNSWRRQRCDYKAEKEKANSLSEKLDGFEMQVYLLRQLLNAEKSRVESANESIQKLTQKIQDINKDKLENLKNQEKLEKSFYDMVEYCSQLEHVIRNQDNEIKTAKLQAEDWEKQLEKEREKLRKIQNEEIVLKKKILQNEETLFKRAQTIDQLNEAKKDLEFRLTIQVALWDEAVAQINLMTDNIKELESAKESLQKTLEEKDINIQNFKKSITDLEKKLQDEDEKNGLLRKSISEKADELLLVRKKISELSNNKYSWNGGMFKMASFCAKIPVACICTVGSLLLPFPSYRL